MSLSGLQTRKLDQRRVSLIGAVALAVGLVVSLWVPMPAGAAANTHRWQTVARGLDNPRGLTVLSHGRVAVAEAGHAGTVCLGPGLCAGLTGQVTVIKRHSGRHVALATGLPSFSGPFGAFGLGGLTVKRRSLYAIVGLSPQSFGDPATDCQGQADVDACVATVTAVQNGSGLLSRVRSLHANRGLATVAAVGRFDFDYAAAHPDPGNPEYAPGDANPFGLVAGPSGGFYVVDAASNTLDFVTRSGDISVLAFVPDPPNHQPIYDAAPTCAAPTSNGDVYIATESNTLWRWDGSHLHQVLPGGKLGQVVGCVADRRGNLYLVNLASRIRGSFPDFNEQPFDGSIVKVRRDGSTSYVATGLNLPTGLALGRHGDLYVTVNGLCPSDLSLLTSENAPPGACPEPGAIIRLRRSNR
jgi:hypothetical protein